MLKRIAYLLLSLLLVVFMVGSRPQGPRNIVAIFAHADDETGIAPVLAKYAENNNVYLVIATDGRYGFTEHAGIEDEEVLIATRAEEAQCSSEKLGINPPVLLGFHDGLGLRDDIGAYFSQVYELREQLQTVLATTEPDVIITYGPDGETGHPDHRLIGAVTTEVLLRQVWPKTPELYYFSWSKEQAARFESLNLHYVDQTHLDTVIEFSPEQEAKAFEAIRCYTSQFTPTEIDEWIAIENQDTTNRLSFRRRAQRLWRRRDF